MTRKGVCATLEAAKVIYIQFTANSICGNSAASAERYFVSGVDGYVITSNRTVIEQPEVI